VEPVGVYYEHSNWYLLAYCHLRQAYRSFRLDRIRQICAADKAFTRAHPAVNELRARQSAEPATDICIRVQRRHARYLYWEREVFGFEREAPEGDFVVMHFACPQPPRFFVRWFLMFADVAEIVHPTGLREELLSILEAGVQNTKKALP
jgi:predicted DNA-binding transcriptional regulator YafY